MHKNWKCKFSRRLSLYNQDKVLNIRFFRHLEGSSWVKQLFLENPDKSNYYNRGPLAIKEHIKEHIYRITSKLMFLKPL